MDVAIAVAFFAGIFIVMPALAAIGSGRRSRA